MGVNQIRKLFGKREGRNQTTTLRINNYFLLLRLCLTKLCSDKCEKYSLASYLNIFLRLVQNNLYRY